MTNTINKQDKPQLWIIAGPNGSGKSTLASRSKLFLKDTLDVINPDNIANIIDPKNPVHHSQAVQGEAGKQAVLKQRECLKNKKSFAIETTFSGNREIPLVNLAKKQGYKTNLVYIGLDDPKKNITRVADRVKQKGHHVPTEDITRRYTRSLENLKNNHHLFDRVVLLDNSLSKHKIKARIIDNKVKSASKTEYQPKWLLDNCKTVKDHLDNLSKKKNKNDPSR